MNTATLISALIAGGAGAVLALIGVIVTAVINARSAIAQRKHDLEMRDADYQRNMVVREADRKHELEIKAREQAHERALERIEDEQRLRVERHGRLRSDLVGLMEVLVLLRRYTWLAQWDQQSDQNEKDRVIRDARERLGLLDARLVLDSDGREISRMVTALTRDVEHFDSMIRTQRQLIQQGVPPEAVISHGEKTEEQWNSIHTAVDTISTKAQALLSEVAKPLPSGSRMF